ncbi:hypothetical protein AMTR_s00003p00251320 [Amborella trichopoda]|uniref:Uncharacterized protein n=1 Tax=Amborella trichopoda TaxID=13333 RepID=W1P8R2_AMBTC|nr:hypothetical protein AMTR_s00003p00251320 [Amborella trichopoda]
MEEGVEVEQNDSFRNDIAAEVDDETIEEATATPLWRYVTRVGGDTKGGGVGWKWTCREGCFKGGGSRGSKVVWGKTYFKEANAILTLILQFSLEQVVVHITRAQHSQSDHPMSK